MTDKVKFVLAVLFLIAGVVGFYMIPEFDSAFYGVLRFFSVVLGLLLFLVLMARTALGMRAITFVKEAKIEAEKIVWPARKETLQLTGLVFVFAVVMAIFLWMTDKSIEWVLYDLILQWRKT